MVSNESAPYNVIRNTVDAMLLSGIRSLKIVLRETTLTFSVSTGEIVSMESQVVRVVSLSTTEISEITRLKIRSSGKGYLNALAECNSCAYYWNCLLKDQKRKKKKLKEKK